MRILISQKIGLIHVLPIVIELLQSDPLIETDYYRGDLLCAVLDLPESIWNENRALSDMMVEVKNELGIILETIKDDILPKLLMFECSRQGAQ